MKDKIKKTTYETPSVEYILPEFVSKTVMLKTTNVTIGKIPIATSVKDEHVSFLYVTDNTCKNLTDMPR